MRCRCSRPNVRSRSSESHLAGVAGPCLVGRMAIVGRVRELWRYPVKSMGGEALAACEVGTLGIAGDRGWAIRDEQVGEIRGAKKLPGLLRCGARYRSEPSAQTIPAVDITLPDGTRTASDDPEVAARLSRLLGRSVTLWPRRPADDRDHYRRAAPDNPDLEQELRQIFGREPDEPLPDLTNIPPEVFEYAAPPGTYFDVYPFHLVTTATLDALAREHPVAASTRGGSGPTSSCGCMTTCRSSRTPGVT